ncbi:MAG TPA: hypothetical protein VEC93_11925, partial [Anaerolineae bacterium]|nr:hypothetical protein [Anaerolineae bacterium]
MSKRYYLHNIRTLLNEGFTDEELRRLCYDAPDFRPVYDELATETGKAKIVDRLVEYAEQKLQVGILLALAKERNPARYEQNQPYEADITSPTPGESPYLGLQYFDEADADLFFGRELLTAKLVGCLREHRFLAIVGASGSGKSSIARAGLVPALKRGEVLADGSLPPEGSTRWPIYIITPTTHPLEALAASLTRDADSVRATATLMDDLANDARSLHLYARKILSRSPSGKSGGGSGDRLLLLVDQFEELFTLCRDEAQRRAFVHNLLTAAAPETAGPTLVVITLRADFYVHCVQFDDLREALAKRQEFIGPMSKAELRRAIEEPAKRGGWVFEPGLVDLLLRDVGDEPGALPLLSHALLETWKHRRENTLTFEGYFEAGRVQGAIAKTAETVFNQRLSTIQQGI